MAYPIMNSPFLPSVADIPGLPPRLKDMPITNPGTHTYLCEDGQYRVMTENEAINLGMSCRVVDNNPASWGYPMVAGYPVMNM